MKKVQRGGKREGAGRKPFLVDAVSHTFSLTRAHMDALDAWGRRHNFDNPSAALRHLIETTRLQVE